MPLKEGVDLLAALGSTGPECSDGFPSSAVKFFVWVVLTRLHESDTHSHTSH